MSLISIAQRETFHISFVQFVNKDYGANLLTPESQSFFIKNLATKILKEIIKIKARSTTFLSRCTKEIWKVSPCASVHLLTQTKTLTFNLINQ